MKKPTRQEIDMQMKSGLFQQVGAALSLLPQLVEATTEWLRTNTKSVMEMNRDSEAVVAAREQMLLARLSAETEEHKLRAARFRFDLTRVGVPGAPAAVVSPAPPQQPKQPAPTQPRRENWKSHNDKKSQQRQPTAPAAPQPFYGTEGFVPPAPPPLGNNIKGLEKIVESAKQPEKAAV